MTDRELLELAAKAAGYEGGEYCETSGCEPALYFYEGSPGSPNVGLWDDRHRVAECAGFDPDAATRRAIVRAAAAIGGHPA